MTEHEKLKEICDEIGYYLRDEYIIYKENEWFYRNFYYECTDCTYQLDKNFEVNVREIIFTQEFMDNFTLKYMELEDSCFLRDMYYDLMYENLNDPVDYLYSLIKN